MDKQKAAIKLKRAIEKAAIRYGLNLTVYQGKIGFVDQKAQKIIALWEPQYTDNARKQCSCDWNEQACDDEVTDDER